MLHPRLSLISASRHKPLFFLQRPVAPNGFAVARRCEVPLLFLRQQRSLKRLPGRLPPDKSKLPPSTITSRGEQRSIENSRWDPHSILDRGPIPKSFYQRHNSTILQPQFSGREAWAGLLGLSGLNFLVLTLWNPEEEGSMASSLTNNSVQAKEWQDVMHRHFTTNITNTLDGRVWTLATASISHQDVIHFAGNMFALWLFGFPTYRVIGTRAFYGLYLVGGLACSVTHVAHNFMTGRTAPPLSQDEIAWIEQNYRPDSEMALPPSVQERLATADRPSLGASGSVMALAAVSAALFPLDKVQPNPLRAGLIVPLPSAVLLYVISDLVGITSRDSPVDHAGHLGGLAMGIIYVTTAWYSKVGSFRILHSHPTGGQLPLLYRIRQWRHGNNPWQR